MLKPAKSECYDSILATLTVSPMSVGKVAEPRKSVSPGKVNFSATLTQMITKPVRTHKPNAMLRPLHVIDCWLTLS